MDRFNLQKHLEEFNTWFAGARKHFDRLKKSKKKTYDEIHELERKMLEEQATATATTQETPTTPRSNISLRQFWLAGVVIVYLGYVLFNSLTVIYLILTAFILSMAIESLILFFQRRMKRGWAMFTAYTLFVLFVLSWFILIIPFFFQQTADLIAVLIGRVNALQTQIQSQGLEAMIESMTLPWTLKEFLISVIQQSDVRDTIQAGILSNTSQIISVWTSYIRGAGDLAVSVVSGLFATLFQLSIVLVMAVFFSIEKNKVIRFISRVSWSALYTELKLKKLYKKLGFWLEGQLILWLAVFSMFFVWLMILSWFGIDLPNKFTLALIAWLFEFIPYLWPTLWSVPAVLVGTISYGLTWLIAVIAMNVTIQQIESNVLTPLVMYHTLWVSPLVIFICMIGGGAMLGLLWVLLAVPLAVILTILFEDYKQPVKQP